MVGLEVSGGNVHPVLVTGWFVVGKVNGDDYLVIGTGDLGGLIGIPSQTLGRGCRSDCLLRF